MYSKVILQYISLIQSYPIYINLSNYFQAKKVQEAQARAAALTREVDIMKNTVKTQKGQVQLLQELLADREQEHR